MKENGEIKVLIVDDEPGILMPLEFLMRKSGYQVYIARNGTEAKESIDQELPQVVVLDLMMPDVDGYEVCRYLRRKTGMGQAKVIVISAKTKEEDIRKAYEAGADAYMPKPFSTRVLVEKVKQLVDHEAES
ncbi:response regulator transcription factor [Pontibacter beigongshangensis]|uniref:response regulator transcription factor n=1 Tax=Pontibacter beigongshangensis TaxID=2574733 RepID=UPI00164FB0DD|nr:response regulator [Pontibacter beigongshangensis]